MKDPRKTNKSTKENIEKTGRDEERGIYTVQVVIYLAGFLHLFLKLRLHGKVVDV